MRRIILLLLVATLVIPMAFASGQGESADAGQRELVINSNLSDPAPRAAFATMVERFEAEYPDIDVTLNTFDHEAYKTAIRNFLASDPPDVALWFAGNRRSFSLTRG
jgi:multiple sugar transport system substrate-binding protein